MRGGTLGGLAGRGREYVVWQLAGLRAAQGKFRACRAGRGLINPSPVPSARRGHNEQTMHGFEARSVSVARF